MPKEKRKLNTRAVLRIYWHVTKQYPWFFCLSIVGILFAQLDKIVGPVYIKQIFNLITQGDTVPSTIVVGILILYTLVSVIGWVGGRLEMWAGYTLISKVSAALTKNAFDNLMHHSYRFFSNSFSGALTRRILRYSSAYENLYYSLISVIFEAVIYIVGITAVLLYQSQTIGLIVLFWVVIFVFLQWWMSRWQQPLRLARAAEDSNLTATLADSISNQNTIALFSGNQYENKVVGAAADTYQKAQLRSWNYNAIIYGVQGLLTIGLNVSILWVAISLIRAGTLTTGDLILIQIYVFGIFSMVWGMGRQFQTIHNSLADASEMIDTMETQHEIKDVPDAKVLEVQKGEISFKDVGFYFNDGADVLKNLSLQVRGGEKVALIGPSGAGKSTITKLLLRLFDVQSGVIQIDNQNIALVTQDSLREAIAFVPQEPILFHRTLMENIRYGKRDATDEEVIEAAKKAHCHEFISKLPLTYQTFVGERGIKLSGGERQRVAIARAILKNAPILVLDEATSSLDSESEMLIQDALECLMEGKTVMVIAHRLSTIMKMDRIVVMEEGTIVAQGTHQELVTQPGLYQKLWSIQAGGFLGGEEAVEQK